MAMADDERILDPVVREVDGRDRMFCPVDGCPHRYATEVGYATRKGYEDHFRDYHLTAIIIAEKEGELLTALSRGARTEDYLADRLKVDKHTLYEIAWSLSKKGYQVRIDQENEMIMLLKHAPSFPGAISPGRILNKYRVVVMAEPRIGHDCEQLSMVHTATELITSYLKPDFIVLGGLSAGKETPSHKGEIRIRTPEGQTKRVVKHYPENSRVKTYVIGGRRDRSWITGKGYDIVSAVCRQRDDLVHAGHESRDFEIGNGILRVMAIGDDVTQRSGRSYQPQRRADEIGAEKPDVLVVCGFHGEVYLPDYAGMHVFSVGSLHRQTKKQAWKGIEIVNNILVLDIELDPETKEIKEVIPTWIPLEHLLQEDDYLAGTEILEEHPLKGLPGQILELLIEDKAVSKGAIKRRFRINTAALDEAMEKVEEACQELGIGLVYKQDTKTYTVLLPPRKEFGPIPGAVEEMLGERVVKAGAISDTHLNEKAQQPRILQKAYRVAEEEEVEFVTHSGDVTGGSGAGGYRGHQFDVIHQAVDDVEDYVAKIWPQVNGLVTYVIGGHHDDWSWKALGHSIVKAISLRRPDLVVVGERNSGLIREIEGLLIKLLHPDGGKGVSLTYHLERKHTRHFTAQHARESDLELILLSGHLHVAVYDRLAGVRGFIVPCMKGVDTYHEGRGLTPQVGMWIITARFDKSGKRISMFTTKYVSLQHMVRKKDYLGVGEN